MTPDETHSDDEPVSDSQILELLRNQSVGVHERLDSLESALEDTDRDVPEALVVLATADDHIFLASQTRYTAFRKLCTEASDRGHDTAVEDVLRQSLAEADDTDDLASEIRSLSTLSQANVATRLGKLESVQPFDGDRTTGTDAVASDDGDTPTDSDEAGSFDGVTIHNEVQTDEGLPDGSASDGRSAVPTENAAPSVNGSDGSEETDGTGPDTDATDATGPESDLHGEGEIPEESISSAPDDRHRERARPAEQTDPTEQGALSMPNYAQDLVDFEFVMESDEDFLPSSVDGSGIILTREDEYVGIIRIEPRSWSIHTDEKKAEIVQGYKSAFLATLDFPIQIVSYPTKFDISDHVNRLEEIAEENKHRSDDSTLVHLGRNLYPNWLERFILDNDMKQRQFYVVVPITADQLNEFQTGTDGFWSAIADKVPPLEPVANKISGDDATQEVSREQCVRELRSRLGRIESGLRRFDVGTERLTDRDEVMSVIYHYYNNEQPMNDAFPTGPYSVIDEGNIKQ